MVVLFYIGGDNGHSDDNYEYAIYKRFGKDYCFCELFGMDISYGQYVAGDKGRKNKYCSCRLSVDFLQQFIFFNRKKK